MTEMHLIEFQIPANALVKKATTNDGETILQIYHTNPWGVLDGDDNVLLESDPITVFKVDWNNDIQEA
jgi:hypothetical protein